MTDSKVFTRTDVLSVACPVCNAAVGQPCVRMAHRPNSHFGRWRVLWAKK